MMHARTVGEARTIAENWIRSAEVPMRAAFIGGSIAYANADAPHDPASDIDCYLVIDGDPPRGKIGKIVVDSVLLDVSWLPWSAIVQGESDAVIASLLRFGRIARDPAGDLANVQQKIIATFDDSAAIRTRLDDMYGRIARGLSGDSPHLPEPEQVMNWLFPATLATHLPLTAACAPLTVRKRFRAAKTVMSGADYEELLALYGFDAITREQAQSWLDETAQLLDATTAIAADSGRFWASDITADAREIAIGGSQQLIDAGLHREALYWIIATCARCLTVRHDAGADSAAFLPAFATMTSALSIESVAARASRSRTILAWCDRFLATY